MGGDACHHCGSLRPTESIPLPYSLSPSPFSEPPHLNGTMCPGALLEQIHPSHSKVKPFYGRLSSTPGRDVVQAEDTVEKLRLFDANADVFVIIAHER